MTGSQKPDLLCVRIPCVLSTGATKTALGSNGLAREAKVGTCLGTKLGKEVGTYSGTESIGDRGACLGTESTERASGAPMHGDDHAGVTSDRAVAAVAPDMTNSGSWS
jgi:hypothetical protein